MTVRVEFESEGEVVVGDLHLPVQGAHAGGGGFGAAILLGPLTSVKEQATGRYAEALARRGWAALSFDPRYFGQSGGEPRQYESPPAKIQDVMNAVSFLAARDGVDARRLVAVGVCAGAGYMAGAVASDQRLRAFGAVAGFFHDADQQRKWLGAGYEGALAKARAAREAWQATGTAERIPAVGKTGDVAMPLEEAFEYYGTDRGGKLGGYVNSFAVMSREQTLVYDAQSAGRKIGVPTVLVHSERALSPTLARAFYERLQVPKAIHWLASKGQIDFYDDPTLIEAAVDLLDREFRTRLG
jgi:uncharacterized protein